jgi:hypothetical protein
LFSKTHGGQDVQVILKREEIMLGLSDPSIVLAYLLSIGGAILCTAYGVINWNKDGSNKGGGEK